MQFRIIGGSVCIKDVPDFLETLRSVSSVHSTTIQAMDAEKVVGKEHVFFAIQKALRAKDKNCNVARDIGVEIMRYASGKRQIEEAFSMGVHEGEVAVVLVVLGADEDVEQSVRALSDIIEEKCVIEYTASKRAAVIEQFSITDKEIEAAGEEMIPSLVLERVALVDVLK